MKSVKRTVYLNKDGKATLDKTAGPVLYMAGAIVSDENAAKYDLEAAYKELAVPAATEAPTSTPVVSPDHYGKTAVKHREKAAKPAKEPPAKGASKAPAKPVKEAE